MKNNTTILQATLFATLFSFGACKSTKISQIQVSNSKQVVETTSKCDQTIKYYSDKLTMANGGEVNANIEIVINPSTKVISITSEPQNQEKVNFETVIESFDCNFNSDLTDGQSIYKGYIKQKDGATTNAIIKVEAKDGSLTISNADPEKEGEFIFIVTKWEVMNE